MKCLYGRSDTVEPGSLYACLHKCFGFSIQYRIIAEHQFSITQSFLATDESIIVVCVSPTILNLYIYIHIVNGKSIDFSYVCIK